MLSEQAMAGENLPPQFCIWLKPFSHLERVSEREPIVRTKAANTLIRLADSASLCSRMPYNHVFFSHDTTQKS